MTSLAKLLTAMRNSAFQASSRKRSMTMRFDLTICSWLVRTGKTFSRTINGPTSSQRALTALASISLRERLRLRTREPSLNVFHLPTTAKNQLKVRNPHAVSGSRILTTGPHWTSTRWWRYRPLPGPRAPRKVSLSTGWANPSQPSAASALALRSPLLKSPASSPQRPPSLNALAPQKSTTEIAYCRGSGE